MKTIKRQRAILLVLISLATSVLLLFIPYNLVLSPERKLVFIDDAGKPITNAEVRQVWHQYSLGVSGEERFKTDVNGVVHLPKHTVDTSSIRLITGALREIRSVGIHAGFGSSEHIMIRIDSQIIKSFYDGKGLENEIVIIKR